MLLLQAEVLFSVVVWVSFKGQRWRVVTQPHQEDDDGAKGHHRSHQEEAEAVHGAGNATPVILLLWTEGSKVILVSASWPFATLIPSASPRCSRSCCACVWWCSWLRPRPAWSRSKAAPLRLLRFVASLLQTNRAVMSQDAGCEPALVANRGADLRRASGALSGRVSLTASRTSARYGTWRCNTPLPWRCSPPNWIAVATLHPSKAPSQQAGTYARSGASVQGKTGQQDKMRREQHVNTGLTDWRGTCVVCTSALPSWSTRSWRVCSGSWSAGSVRPHSSAPPPWRAPWWTSGTWDAKRSSVVLLSSSVSRCSCVTYLTISGTDMDVSGSRWEISSKKTDWANSTEMDNVIFSPPAHKHTQQNQPTLTDRELLCVVELNRWTLTVGRQVVDERGQEGDEHTGNDDVDYVEQRLAFNDQVEGDVLVLVALHGDVFVGVSPGRTVDDLPLTVLCQHSKTKVKFVKSSWRKICQFDKCFLFVVCVCV